MKNSKKTLLITLMLALSVVMFSANAFAIIPPAKVIDYGTWVVHSGGVDVIDYSQPDPRPNGVRVRVNGNYPQFDVQPYINEQTNRTMIPIRYVAEALGAKVSWEQASHTATIVKGDKTMKMTVGANQALVNGNQVALDAPVELKNSRTMVPLRFISENFGATVKWDATNRIVDINQ